MARPDLVRHQLFVPRHLSERFEAFACAPGASKSRILASAVASFIERNGQIGLEFVERVGQSLASGRPSLVAEEIR